MDGRTDGRLEGVSVDLSGRQARLHSAAGLFDPTVQLQVSGGNRRQGGKAGETDHEKAC